jgi:hypothetical protein
MKKEERVLYIAVMRQPHHDHQNVEVFSSCLDGVDEGQVRKFIAHKLRNIKEVSVSMIGCLMGRKGGINWTSSQHILSFSLPIIRRRRIS